MNGNAKHRIWLGLPRRDGEKQESVEGTLNPSDFHEALQRERSRSGRTGLPLSLVVFWEVPGGNGDSSKPHKLLTQLAQLLTGRTRCTDLVGWVDSRKVALLLPDTNVEGACKVVEDVRDAFASKCGGQERMERILYRVHTSDAEAGSDVPELSELSELAFLSTTGQDATRDTYEKRG